MTDSPMATRTVEDLLLQGKAARAAARQVARLSTNVKNDVLLGLADSLQSDTAEVLAANAGDYAAAQAEGLERVVAGPPAPHPRPSPWHRRRVAQRGFPARPGGRGH